MGENTAVAKTDIVGNLAAVTGKKVEELRLATVALLPKEARGSFENLAAFVMRCRSVGVDPFGNGVYAAMMRGDMKVLLHYNTYVGLALKTGLIGRGDWNVECVYPGEKFTFTTHTVTHEMDPAKRKGIPQGAYAMGKASDMSEPLVIYISYDDFKRNADSTSSAWRASAYEMTTKAAVKVLFKRLFPDVYAGVNMAGDFGEDAPVKATITEAEKDALAEEMFAEPDETAEAEVEPPEMSAEEKAKIEKQESAEAKAAAERDKAAAKKNGALL